MTLNGRHFGWKKDRHDAHARTFARSPGLTRLESVRYDALIPKIRDQGPTSSCVGHACVNALELMAAIEGNPVPRLSPAHAYWLARAQDGFEHEDGGAFISSCVKALRQVGCCDEGEWPLDPARINVRPSLQAEMSGVKFADIESQRIDADPDAVADVLQLGHIPMLGVNVTTPFVFCHDNQPIPAPKPGDVRQGGHAFAVVGFVEYAKYFLIENSWGTSFGFGGLALVERDWFTDREASDVVAIVRVPRAEAA